MTAPSGVSRRRPCSRASATIEVVIAPWDATHPAGGEVYRWVLQNRADLRNRFVFIADEVPPEFDAVVGGRCLAVPLVGADEIVRVAQRRSCAACRTPPRGVPDCRSDRPSLLLADDDPLLLERDGRAARRRRLRGDHVESGGEACIRARAARLRRDRASTGACTTAAAPTSTGGCSSTSPRSRQRVVFLSEADADDSGPVAPGRPMFRKGQDFQALSDMLRMLVRNVKAT